MSVHAVVIGTSQADVETWVASKTSLDRSDVLWVSPRSPDRCRGVRADAVLITAARSLIAVARPCTATTAAEVTPTTFQASDTTTAATSEETPTP